MPLALLKEGTDVRKVLGLLVLEAAVIFGGISSSFWMEEWRQQREDEDTYAHLLEEIYYNATLDRASIPISIASNNLALKDALQLTVLNNAELSDAELYDRLDHVFSYVGAAGTTAGYNRLANTSLSIPFDETMLTLDTSYEFYDGLEEGLQEIGGQIAELRAEHWRSAGMISCTGAEANDGTVILMERPYMSEIRALLYPDGECITQPDNSARARELLSRPAVRNAVRQIVDLRQNAAWLMGLQQGELEQIRAAIERRLPDVGLPIVSMELISWPLETNETTERHAPMRSTGPHTWEATAELSEGFMKFKANQDWSLNWGARFPDIIDAPRFLWNSDRVRVEDVFPAGTAHLNGMNLPVRAGIYRVRFNVRTGEYTFEPAPG
jgi:hypothetical protein